MRTDINWIIFLDEPHLNTDVFYKLQISWLNFPSLLPFLGIQVNSPVQTLALPSLTLCKMFSVSPQSWKSCLSGKFSWNIPVFFQEPSSLLRLLKLDYIEEYIMEGAKNCQQLIPEPYKSLLLQMKVWNFSKIIIKPRILPADF